MKLMLLVWVLHFEEQWYDGWWIYNDEGMATECFGKSHTSSQHIYTALRGVRHMLLFPFNSTIDMYSWEVQFTLTLQYSLWNGNHIYYCSEDFQGKQLQILVLLCTPLFKISCFLCVYTSVLYNNNLGLKNTYSKLILWCIVS